MFCSCRSPVDNFGIHGSYDHKTSFEGLISNTIFNSFFRKVSDKLVNVFGFRTWEGFLISTDFAGLEIKWTVSSR